MEEENTIALIDLLRVIWKWKWFIITITLACCMIAGVVSFSMPSVYEVSMVIEPGVFDISPNGQFIYLDSPSNIQSKVDTQAYNNKILKKLEIDPAQLYLKFKTIQPRNSNTIRIWLELVNIPNGIKALSSLFDELIREYSHYIDDRRSEIEQKIFMNERQLDVKFGEVDALKEEIAMVKANTDRIIEERSRLMNEGSDNVDKLSLLIYTNTIQQNIAQYNDLNRQLAVLKSNLERLKTEIGILNIKKKSIENIKLIQWPQSSIYPIGPRNKVNIILGFASGLFLSVFLAFFIEYLRKAKVAS